MYRLLFNDKNDSGDPSLISGYKHSKLDALQLNAGTALGIEKGMKLQIYYTNVLDDPNLAPIAVATVVNVRNLRSTLVVDIVDPASQKK